jgi:hypothetical protein
LGVAELALIRDEWSQMWDEADQSYIAEKNANGVLPFLAQRYRELSDAERPEIDELIVDRVLSEDEGRRFDALYLVRTFLIKSAIPNLKALVERVNSEVRPGAPFEAGKVKRILGQLGVPSSELN